ADIFKYFDDSAVMFDALRERPLDYFRMVLGIGNDTTWFTERYYMSMNNWFRQFESNLYNDAHTIIRFNAVVRIISFGEFHVHTVIAAFLSLTGMVGMYRAFVGFLKGRERALIIAVFLLPSVLFWASGVIKESLLFFGLGMVVHQVMRMIGGRITPLGIAVLVLCAVLLFFLKFYVLLSLVPALVLYAWCRRRPKYDPWALALVVYGCALLLVLSTPYLIPGLDILQVVAAKQQDFIGLVREMGSGSFVMPPRLEPDLLSFVKLAPYALYITLLGPLVHATPGLLGMFAAVENVGLLLFLVVCSIHRQRARNHHRDLLLALFLYVILLSLVIGWTSPVMGAVVRYRTPVLPFLMIWGLLLVDTERLFARWPRLRPYLSA
ncbi:MAG: hypothetical protein KDB84_11825, partial [Flavobacteriales bacterium]|nr:hypothetical protein [Flavobacteriales bacterium]